MGGEKLKYDRKKDTKDIAIAKVSNVLTCWKKFDIKFWPRDSRLKRIKYNIHIKTLHKYYENNMTARNN